MQIVIDGVKDAVVTGPNAKPVAPDKFFASGWPRIRLEVVDGIGDQLASLGWQIAIFTSGAGFQLYLIRHFLPPRRDSLFISPQA